MAGGSLGLYEVQGSAVDLGEQLSYPGWRGDLAWYFGGLYSITRLVMVPFFF